MTKTNLGSGGFIRTSGHISLREARAGTQGSNKEAGTKLKAIEECCLLSLLPLTCQFFIQPKTTCRGLLPVGWSPQINYQSRKCSTGLATDQSNGGTSQPRFTLPRWCSLVLSWQTNEHKHHRLCKIKKKKWINKIIAWTREIWYLRCKLHCGLERGSFENSGTEEADSGTPEKELHNKERNGTLTEMWKMTSSWTFSIGAEQGGAIVPRLNWYNI